MEKPVSLQEQNKAVVERYVQAFNRGDLPALRSLLTDDAEIQGVMGHGVFERVEPIWRGLIEGYGMQLHVEQLVAEGNLVAARYTETGTFKAPAFGNQPTGRSYTLVAMELFEIRDGKIAKRWGARDSAAQARQLGIPLV
jgi:predicted ester cyclase